MAEKQNHREAEHFQGACAARHRAGRHLPGLQRAAGRAERHHRPHHCGKHPSRDPGRLCLRPARGHDHRQHDCHRRSDHRQRRRVLSRPRTAMSPSRLRPPVTPARTSRSTSPLDAEGAVSGISIDGSTQTTGIGSKVSGDSFASGFIGWNGERSASGSPVDSIAGATYSSNGAFNAINAAIDCYNNEIKGVQ